MNLSVRSSLALTGLALFLAATTLGGIISYAEETYIYRVNLYTYRGGSLIKYNMLVLVFYPSKGEISVSSGLVKPNLDERDALIKVFNLKPDNAVGRETHIYAVEGVGVPYICRDLPLFEVKGVDIDGTSIIIARDKTSIPVKFEGNVRVRGLVIHIELELAAAAKPICGNPISGDTLRYAIGIMALLLTITALYTFIIWRKTLVERWSLTPY